MSAFALFDDGDAGCWLFEESSDLLECHEPGHLEDFFHAVQAAAAAGLWVVLAADYEAGYWLEDRLRPLAPAGGEPLLSALVFASRRRLDPAGTEDFLASRLDGVSGAGRVAGVCELRPDIDDQAFMAAVRRIKDYIVAGDCYQVNFTYGLQCRAYGHPLALYARLRAAQPVRYGGFVAFPGRHVLSLSPELFLERRGSRLLSRPMKGTAPRGRDHEEDLDRAARLAASPKERAENVMIVDLIRNDLGRLAVPGSVRVDQLCAVERYPSVFQMVSDVSAEVPAVRLADVFRALFPCGSITGAPKIRAMEIVREVEAGPRGLYTGSLGWLSPDGDFRLNVAIRTLVLEGRQGRLGIGAGIVAESVPEAELAECRSKARFLVDLLPGFQLIETLRLEAGAEAPFTLLDLHLERLMASAASLGFAVDGERVRQKLLAHAREQGRGVYKTRLLLDPDGMFSIDSTPLPATAVMPVGVIIAAGRVDSGDVLLRHKTSVRHLYDGAIARLPAGAFDALFLNERGELCEGARCNLFLRLEGRLFTPPLSSGLLPGVQRRKILSEGGAEERVLFPQDLGRAEAIFLSNAVRGLLPAVLLPGCLSGESGA